MTKADVLRILTILSRHYKKQECTTDSLSKKKDELKRLEQAFFYMKEHYTEKISLSDVAGVACMSPNYFSSYFKKVTNQNFQDYLAELRIKKASELLKSSSLGILEIAQQCGFHNISNFYKLFKKYKGYAPRSNTKDS
jgi:YesN/AraC family two-component response regulator